MKKLLAILSLLPVLALADPPTTNYPAAHLDPANGHVVTGTGGTSINGNSISAGGGVTITGTTPASGDFPIFSGAGSVRIATNSEVPILDASGSWVPYFDSTIYKRLLFDTPFTIVDSGSDKLISVDLSNYLTLDGDGQNVTVNGNALGDWFGATGQNIANLFTGATTATFGAINGNTIGAGSTSGANTGDQTITLTGNVTGSGTGSFAATIANSAVTLAKMADIATSSLIYRKTSGTGAPEVNTLATLKTDLGLTGTNSGDQTITLTGDVTGSGTGSFATTLGTVAVAKGGTNITSYAIGDLIYASASTTLSKLADVATGSVLISGGVTTAPAWSTTPTFVGTNISGTAASLTAGHVTTNANLTGEVTSSGNAASLGSFTMASFKTALSDETTVVNNLLSLANPSAISFVKIAADNSVSTRTPAQMQGDLGGSGWSFTSPAVTTGINDTNGNSMLAFTATASAVDGFTFTNAATAGHQVTIAATGSDSNIDIILTPKGTGGTILGAGALASPSLRLVSSDTAGWYSNSANQWTLESGGTSPQMSLIPAGGLMRLDSAFGIVWGSGNSTTSADSGISRIAAGVIGFGTGSAGSVAGSARGTFVSAGTNVTCTGGTIGTASKSNAGSVTATTTGTSTIVLTFPVTAPTGWNVSASDVTAVTNLVQTASSTTTATLSGTTVSGDVIRYIAMAY